MTVPDPASWVLDDLPIGVWVGQAPDGRVSYANRAFRRILGMEAVSESAIEDAPATYGIFDEAGQPFPVDQLPFSQVMATGAAAIVDGIVLHRHDGSRVNVRAFAHPVRDGGGGLTHVIVAFIDITREVRAEAERASVEARLRLALDHAPIAVFSVDLDGIITFCEGDGLKSLGVSPSDLIGQSAFDLYRDHPTLPGYLRRALAGESFWYTVHIGQAVYDTWLAPLRGPSGQISGVLGVANDMTELRRLQAGVIQSDRVRAMGALAASVAHEINNPLTYILGSIDNAQRALGRISDAPPRLREDLELARKGVERIATITRDLRTFSRPDDTRREPVDTRAAIESVIKLVRKQVEARAILKLAFGDAPPVVANEARLVQVVMNLVMNAVQSLPGGRSGDVVAITTRSEGERVLIEIADTGPGVPAGEREHIFEPFVTTKPLGEGTGLGLFVCRNIVRGLGGEVSVHDRAGGGALFRVSLPAVPRPTPAVGIPMSAEAGPANGRVLVIDDDALVSATLSAQLQYAGFVVEEISDPRRALETLVADDRFDLVFCDLMMKGLTGMELAAELARRAPERLPRMVFMTGGAFAPEAVTFFAEHARDCVEKPFDVVGEARRRLGR
jgi:two-component system NtrC family sensor kinase